jgi:hypothetical protein
LTLRHLASDHAIDHHALNRYLLAGGRNAKELAAMGAMPRKAAKYLIPFTHHLFDHPMDIGKRSAKRVNHLLKTFAPLLLARKSVDFYEINRHKIVSSLNLTLVDDLLDKSTDNRFVLFCCNKMLSFSANFGNTSTV